MAAEWSSEPLNLFSPEIAGIVRAALDQGIVCGFRALYRGGGGPEACAFTDFNAYTRYVEASRPGDWLTLWSVPELCGQDRLLLRKQSEGVSQAELDEIELWLHAVPGREFLAVGRMDAGASPETAWGDKDCFAELKDLCRSCAPKGEFAVLPLTDLTGPGEWLPKFHLIDAKRPNERGEVPLGGPY